MESIFANKVDDNFNQSGGVNQASGYSQSHGLGQTSGYNQSGQRSDTKFFNQQTVQPKVGQHQPYQNQSVPQQKLQQTSPQQQFYQANLQTSHPNASNPFNNKNNQSVRFQPNNNNLNSSLNNVGGNWLGNSFIKLEGFGKINNLNSSFLVDTGTPITIISEDLAEELGATIEPISPDTNIFYADGAKAEVRGKTLINFQIAAFIAQFFVLVVRNLSEKCLVGLDVLYTCPATAKCLKKIEKGCRKIKIFFKK